MNRQEEKDKPIAFFDSGVGGLTVLAAAVRCLPGERFIYYGDTAYAPYGGRSVPEVRARSARVAGELYGRGCKALVVACNTATSAAIDFLRAVMAVPVIGMEPALKPALAANGGGSVLVMATPLTLREEKFKHLCSRFAAENVIVLPCSGIVELVERGQIRGPVVQRKLSHLLGQVGADRVRTVVLGCTHYLFVRDELAGLLPPGTVFMDGNLGTVKQLRRVLEERDLLAVKAGTGCTVEFLSSGDNKSIRRFEEMFAVALKLYPKITEGYQ